MKFKTLLLIFIFIICIHLNIFASEINIGSEAGLLVEVSTGKVLFEKNSTKKMFPASTTKILTGILVIENCNLTDIVTVPQSALENIPSGYVTCNISAGEELTVNDLLHVLMIPSANDAAYVLAEYVGGSVSGFSDMMNKKALEIGCTNTHFVNPNGIHDDTHYTTAYDLYLMANYAMKNETFREIVSKISYTLPETNKHSSLDRVFHTTNELLNSKSRYFYENTIGVKTGHTAQAGNCLVAQSSKDNLEFISVVLNGGTTNSGLNERYIDSKNLLEYGYNNYTFTTLIPKSSILKTIEVENGTKETKNLDLVIDNDIYALHNKTLDFDSITPEITLQENILAPITKGTVLGHVKYNIDGTEYESNLIANTDVEKNMDVSIILIIVGFTLLILSSFISKKKRKRK